MSPQTPVNPILNLVPLALLFVIFYFLIIRPQKKQESDRQKMISSLNKNDEVVTTGGIHGTVVTVKEKTVIVRIDENVKVEVEKNCVSFVKKTQSA
jgi:preprotein translocase subunit YajC